MSPGSVSICGSLASRKGENVWPGVGGGAGLSWLPGPWHPTASTLRTGPSTPKATDVMTLSWHSPSLTRSDRRIRDAGAARELAQCAGQGGGKAVSLLARGRRWALLQTASRAPAPRNSEQQCTGCLQVSLDSGLGGPVHGACTGLEAPLPKHCCRFPHCSPRVCQSDFIRRGTAPAWHR